MFPFVWHVHYSKAPHRRPRFSWQVFPWQVLFARVHSINWQVFPWQEALFKSWSCQLLNNKNCSCVRPARKTLSIQENVRTSSSRKTCPAVHASKQNLSRKCCGEKLVHCTHEQVKLPRNLSRKTWLCVRGLKENPIYQLSLSYLKEYLK